MFLGVTLLRHASEAWLLWCAGSSGRQPSCAGAEIQYHSAEAAGATAVLAAGGFAEVKQFYSVPHVVNGLNHVVPIKPVN